VTNLHELIHHQTPVLAIVRLLDGGVRQRVGVITGVDGNVMRMYDLTRAADGTVKGFRSAPITHVISIQPIPVESTIHTLVRQSVAAAYSKGPQ
jgi:hypothetical protein